MVSLPAPLKASCLPWDVCAGRPAGHNIQHTCRGRILAKRLPVAASAQAAMLPIGFLSVATVHFFLFPSVQLCRGRILAKDCWWPHPPKPPRYQLAVHLSTWTHTRACKTQQQLVLSIHMSCTYLLRPFRQCCRVWRQPVPTGLLLNVYLYYSLIAQYIITFTLRIIALLASLPNASLYWQ